MCVCVYSRRAYAYVCNFFQDHQHAGKNGVVRAIMNNMASVYLYDDGQEIDVPTRSIEPTAPSKFDKVSQSLSQQL